MVKSGKAAFKLDSIFVLLLASGNVASTICVWGRLDKTQATIALS
jgi:hypothetical protein